MSTSYGLPLVEKYDSTESDISGTYPLSVAYDAFAFATSDGGTGKGAQLRTLLGEHASEFSGLAPAARNGAQASVRIFGREAKLIRSGVPRYLLWQQTALPRLLEKTRPQIFLAPYNTAPLHIPRGTKLVSVVHDLILLEHLSDSGLKQRLIDRYRAMLLERTIRRSSLVLTVSEFTANDIRRRFPGVVPRVIHCTVDRSWYGDGNDNSAALDEPYILLVSNFRAHKNTPRAMEAFARYRTLNPASGIKLRMVGVWHERHAVENMMAKLDMPQDSVIVESFLSEAELQKVYRQALCVLIPSQMEGFGIPVLEAMASGTPLLCSNTWSLPEVGGDAPLYFDPLNVEEMTQALLRVSAEADLRAKLVQRGLARAERFHPDRIHADVRRFWAELPALYRSWTS